VCLCYSSRYTQTDMWPARGAHKHTTVLRPFFWDYLGKLVPKEILWTFMVQGKITEADTLTIQLGATPSGLISGLPPSSPIFTPDALPVATLLLCPGLGQAPNMLGCIPSGVGEGTSCKTGETRIRNVYRCVLKLT